MRRRSVHLSQGAIVGGAGVVAAFILYADNGGAPHFVLHALIGTTVGVSILLIWRGLGRPPRPGELWLPFGLSAYAMVPDALYKLGPYHRDWMDVFLGHVSADELRDVTTPVLIGLLPVLVLLHTVLAGRQRRQFAVLQPHIIRRPWGRLCVRRGGNGPPVLAIHGLGGSGRYWEGLAAQVRPQHTLLAPDLGGFGASDKPPGPYDLEFHLANLDTVVGGADEPVVLVGHSFGAVLAAVWACRHPERVTALALVAAPYPDGSQQTRAMILHDRLTRAMAGGGLLSHAVHTMLTVITMALRPLLRSRSIPREVIADYMRHTIPSYVGSLRAGILDVDITPLLRPVGVPILLLYGSRDTDVAAASAAAYRRAFGAGRVEVVEGDHQLLLEADFAPLLRWLEAVDRDAGLSRPAARGDGEPPDPAAGRPRW